MPAVECPRCGPGWQEKHKRQFLVLRLHRKYGLCCITAEMDERIPAGEGGFYA